MQGQTCMHEPAKSDTHLRIYADASCLGACIRIGVVTRGLTLLNHQASLPAGILGLHAVDFVGSQLIHLTLGPGNAQGIREELWSSETNAERDCE